MEEKKKDIRNNEFFRYSSATKFIKFHIPGFAFKHDNSINDEKDKFVGRELLMNKLFLWLSSTSRSGSYLITGYRGMGKSVLVNRVLERICRPQKLWKELLYYAGSICVVVAAVLMIVFYGHFKLPNALTLGIVCGVVGVLLFAVLYFSKIIAPFKFWRKTIKWRWGNHFYKNHLSKYVIKIDDGRNRKYNNIPIDINLGQEVLNERDVLGIIAQNVRDKYRQFVLHGQNRPFYCLICLLIGVVVPCLIAAGTIGFLTNPFGAEYSGYWTRFVSNYRGFKNFFCQNDVLKYFAASVYTLFWLMLSCWVWIRLRKKMPYMSTPYKAIRRLDNLCDRINASVDEDQVGGPSMDRHLVNVSFLGKGRKKVYPIANVREIEQELQEIINQINTRDHCPQPFIIQFIIVFDELDKVAGVDEEPRPNRDAAEAPEFDTAVEGFTGTMGYESRKRDILHLLANMKLFIATVKAKCVFISGHELYDASLADLSDREFAISSIFNGVLNVDSFLSPERDQNEVSSMTELYLSNMLLPKDHMLKKMKEYADKHHLLKEELPSLRWYNEYLLDEMRKCPESSDNQWMRDKEQEIRYAVEFLRYFAIYLAHVCNGSPKKISTYFEKYVRINHDVDTLYEWGDVLTFGKPTEKDTREQCVLWFDANAQRFINFMYYIASPVMKVISNEVSHYGDKLLVTSSFMLDQIYKYHGKGFSWRNLEQMPELLNANKNPELRDSMASMMEFLLQTHITRMASGIYQYKFHKQIAEEITYISMTSEEASAIFNFTLNESGTVKRYNMRLLSHYLKLSRMAPDGNRYQEVIERIHENLGDIYFMDEDYYCAIHEYRNALKYIEEAPLTPDNVVGFLKCSLKIGMSYEYRRTFENAYMMYNQTINKLIHLRWIDERSIGLDYTSKWTDDWRVKQPLLLNHAVLREQMGPEVSKEFVSFSNRNRVEHYVQPTDEEVELDKQFRRQFLSGIWKDIRKSIPDPAYSTTTDSIISGLSSNLTPEKSDILRRLTVFEDVRYIYLAIIAKLFLIEKMELGGTSYSSVEIAEAEFMYLHSATKLHDKFMVSADFFHKMAEIMYYKNGYIIPVTNVDNIVSSLYFYGFNLLGFVDDFIFNYTFNCCGVKCRKDAVAVKETLNDFFNRVTLQDCLSRPEDRLLDELAALVPEYVKNYKPDDSNEYAPDDVKEDIENYLKYIGNLIPKDISGQMDKVAQCDLRRTTLLKIGYKLPCNACRYASRSMRILMDHLFVDENNQKTYDSDVFKLLSLTSRKHIRHIRQSELSLLANTAEQLGDIMLSCSLTRTEEFDDMSRDQHPSLFSFDWDAHPSLQDDITVSAIELLEFLTGSAKSEVSRIQKLDEMASRYFSKLDKALLYYWSAARFYEMASLCKEAAYCMERMLKVIQGYLKVIGSSAKGREECLTTIGRLYSDITPIMNQNDHTRGFLLVQNLFRQTVRLVSKEFDNNDLGEIHEYRWLFHMERMDDVDLTRLTGFTDLKSALLIAMDIKIRSWEYLRRFHVSLVSRQSYHQLYRQYISKVYGRISAPLRHDKTFKEEVLGFFTKAQINKRVLIDCLGGDFIIYEKVQYFQSGTKSNRKEIHSLFYEHLNKYLNGKSSSQKIDTLFFKTRDIKSRLALIEYLIQDSFVCLSSVLSVLTPHNHLTTFPNYFMAEVYDLMWEWSKYYEMLYDLYLYNKYNTIGDKETMAAISSMMARNTTTTKDSISSLLKQCVSTISANVKDHNDFGYIYTRLLMSIRHDVDDATIHHIFTNVSAELATKYYQMSKDVNNEGPAYKNMVMGMYVMDDDLRNDTCQAALADERYLWHCGLIDRYRDMMIGMYEGTNIRNLGNYEYEPENAISDVGKRLSDRLEDSPYLNSEY